MRVISFFVNCYISLYHGVNMLKICTLKKAVGLFLLFSFNFLIGAKVFSAECGSSVDNTIVSTRIALSEQPTVFPYTVTDILCSDVTYSGLKVGDGIVVNTEEQGLVYSVFSSVDGAESTLTSAVQDNEYISFTLTPNANNIINVAGSHLQFLTQRIDWHSPRYYAVMTSVDGFNAGNEIYNSERNERLGAQTLSLYIANESRYRNLDSPIEIRLYPYGAKFANHQVSMLGFSLSNALEIDEEVPTNDISKVLSRQIIGTNLGPLSDGSGVVEVIDLMKKSRRFITQDLVDRRSWDSNLYDQMPKDENGYPLEVPFTINDSPQQQVVTVLNNPKTPVPTGDYLFTYDGEGEFSFIPQRSYQSIEPGRGILTIDHSTPQIQLNIKSSVKGNHLRNMKLLLPEHHNVENSQVFTDEFLESVQPFDVIRYLAWTKTNGSKVSSWDQRTTLSTQGQNQIDGVSAELIIELSNQSKSDPWINIPHMANDEYIRQLAELYRDNLNPELNIYVEYSNEIWNNRFIQTRYAREQGELRGYTALPGGTMNNFYSERTVEVINIFEQVFADKKDKIIGVMAGNLTSDWGLDMRLRYNWSENQLTHKETGIDVISIAPYFGNEISAEENISKLEEWADTINADGLDNLFEEIINGKLLPASNAELSPLQTLLASIDRHIALSKRVGLPLIAYEGGQHLVVQNSGNRTQDDKITELFHRANRDPRMKDIYNTIFNHWFESGGGLFANFSHISRWSRSGAWGNIEYAGQPLEETPKYQAVLDTIARLAIAEDNAVKIERQNITGSEAQDTLKGTNEHDFIQGLASNDHIFASRGLDIIDGGDGWDTLDFRDVTDSVEVYLFSNASTNNFDESSEILNIEGITGSDYDDILVGNDKDNYINGRSGADVLQGRSGNNYINGGADIDIAIFELLLGDYVISQQENKTYLQSEQGITTLINVEQVQFGNGAQLLLEELINGNETQVPENPDPEPVPEPTPNPEPNPTPIPSPEPGSQAQYVKNYIFGHSLIRHAPRLDLPLEDRNDATAETAVPYWMHKLADANENGHTYALTGQYGFLTGHSDLPPRAHWNFHRDRNEPYPWTDWNMTFAEANFTDVTITPANFIQRIGPDENYQSERFSHTSPLLETLKIADWVNEQEPGIKLYIYENWGNLGTQPGVERDAPIETITQTQLHDYHEFVQTEFHDWWVEYYRLVREARPEFNIEMIPVGPIMAKLLNDERFSLNTIPAYELYEDIAPHGRPTIYFLASLINYMAMYDQRSPSDIVIPDTIHFLVKNNYEEIVEYIWQELQEPLN